MLKDMVIMTIKALMLLLCAIVFWAVVFDGILLEQGRKIKGPRSELNRGPAKKNHETCGEASQTECLTFGKNARRLMI